MAWEKLTTTNIVQLIGGLGAVILAGVIGFFVSQSLKADLRYEEGQYYRSGGEIVVSLKVKNYGRGDAKDIIISTNFPKPLVKNPVTSDDTYPCAVVAGGKGEESVSVSVKRLVPDQTLYLYYVITDAKKPMAGDKASFVSGVTYEGGKGKAGEPLQFSVLLTILLAIGASVLTTLFSLLTYRHLGRITQATDEIGDLANKTLDDAQAMAEASKAAIKLNRERDELREAAIKSLTAERDELRKQLAEEKAKNSQPPAEPTPTPEPPPAPKPPRKKKE